jgi:hypothetical protein
MLSVLLAAAALAAGPGTPPTERCQAAPPGTPAAAELLARARAVTGALPPGDSVLHFRAAWSVLNDYQSDRSYPPFFSVMERGETWYDPATGVERRSSSTVFPGQGPGPEQTILAGPRATFVLRDTAALPVAMLHPSERRARLLNPWAVLRDWSEAADARVAGSCVYRDFPRLVLERAAEHGTQRLYLDARTGYPLKVDETEPHYLWGQVRAEYVYSNWIPAGGGAFPATSFRVVDGETEVSRTVGTVELAARPDAPRLAAPAAAPMPVLGAFEAGAAERPDTVRVGSSAVLLRSRWYTEGAVLLGDTVYVLDATLGERRARADSAWIETLFPGRHPVAVVVTDLAWPHVAGVRYWVARGATIISHRASEPFLRRVVERRWTLAPDLLERRRASSPLRFRAVEDSALLAGGRLRLYAINGIGSEGALMAWLPGERFLWAGDYVQTVREPSAYAAEVIAAVWRAGVRPERVAAQHLPLTEWAVVERVNGVSPR